MLAQPIAVRGYANVLFGRNIYEAIHNINDDRIRQIALEKNKQYVVYLSTRSRDWSMPEYTDYLVYDVFNDCIVIDDATFYVTDNNWERGYSKHFVGFFVHKMGLNWKQYVIGAHIKVSENDLRQIVNIEEHESYLYIHLEGEPFDIQGLDYPVYLTIEGN